MSTLYWITTLDRIIGLCVFLVIIAGIASVIGLTLWNNDDRDEEKKKFGRKILSVAFPSVIFMLVAVTLVPSTDDAYIIYGVGQTLDYLKENKDAKKLPDKAVKALNAFLDNEIRKDSTQNQ
jgi:glucose uptake protein GlcU